MRPKQRHRALDTPRRIRLHRQFASDKQQDRKREQAPEGNVPSPDLVDQEPGRDVPEHREDLLGYGKLEALGGGVPGELDVVGAVAGDEEDAAQGLGGEGEDGDHCASQVGFAETFQICDAFCFLPDFV